MDKLKNADSMNRLRWNGRPGHYEVYYITLNHLESGSGFWIRYTMTAPEHSVGEAYSQLWFSYFNHGDPSRNFALKKKFPIEALKDDGTNFSLRIGDNELSGSHLRGVIEGNGHRAGWDLSHSGDEPVHLMMPKFLYLKELADTTAVCVYPDSRFHGSITIDGEKLDFNGDPGDQTHLWGEKHAQRWAWVHCNAFDGSPGSLLEGLSVQVVRGGFTTPPINLFRLKHGGEDYSFTEIPGILRSSGSFDLGNWNFTSSSGNSMIKGEISCRADDLVRADYLDPDGEEAFCHNTEVASCNISVYKRKNMFSAWTECNRLGAEKTCHVEFAGRTPDARVKKIIEDAD
ncbi:MAG TPA: tocopherol cyclase family protein [bacterium]|nr:tocopherol cyclase family protein [bacterium]